MNKILRAMLVTVLAFLILGLLVTGCAGGSEPPTVALDPSMAIIGQKAPDFRLKNINGQSVSLSDFYGQPVLINFWASWCTPCVSEMPYIEEIYTEWSDKGLVLLTINIGDSSSKVEAFLHKYNLSLPVLLDTKKTVAQQYNIRFIPTTFFIDNNGTIQESISGAFPSKTAIENRLIKIMP